MTESAIAAVSTSGAYQYVSPDDFAKNWTNALTEKDRKLFGPNPAAQMKNLKQYRPLFVHEDLGTLNEFKDRWRVDLVIVGEIRREGDAMVLSTEIVSMDTGRLYTVNDEFQPKEASELVKRQASLSSYEGSRDYESQRGYCYRSTTFGSRVQPAGLNGEYIRVVMDYSSNRPSPDLQNIDIVPHRPINDGILPLKVGTKEKKPITFQYFYRQGKFVNIKISTDRPKKVQDNEAEYEETLTVISKGGYELRFTFKWKGQEAKGVRVEPVINPYSEVR